MQKWGNKRANEYWEYNLPKSYPRPTENSTMADLEKFIRAKYEKKCWVRDDYSSEYSSSSEDEKPKSSSLSAIRSKPSPTPKSVSPTPSINKSIGGLSSLSKKNNSASRPMDDLFMSLTLRTTEPTKLESHDSMDDKARTGSISSLYGPKSPQIDVSMDSIIKKRQALQKLNQVSSPRLKA